MCAESPTPGNVPAFDMIGKLLLKAGLCNAEGLTRALLIKERDHLSLGKALANLGLAEEEAVSSAIAQHLHFDYLGTVAPEIGAQTSELISAELCRKRFVVPLGMQGSSLRVAIADPLAYHAIQDVEFLTGKRVIPVVASQTTLLKLLDLIYPLKEEPVMNAYELLLDGVPAGQVEDAVVEEPETVSAKLEQDTKLAPIVQLVNLILSNAAKDGVSDIHFERYEDFVQVRYRIDGLLRDVLKIPKGLQEAAISRLKITSGLDITERRKPQDGRGQMRFEGRKIALRVSTLPTQFGEKVVIRLLDSSKAGVPMEKLGFSPENLAIVQTILSSPQGMVLVTGPTGSGKTTTLYTALNWLKSPTKNIITVEDPIEYQIGGINQVQTNVKAGLTFAAGLRSILRQDPNIILVGEIRDMETAEIAFAAAQTGHLLLSTLHSNDATATITRLLDIGVAPFLIASSLLGVIAQRLVRKICSACSAPRVPGADTAEQTPNFRRLLAETPWMAGRGCPECQQTGYKGRIGIHEAMQTNDEVRDLISTGGGEIALRAAARRGGMRTMMEDGIAKGAQGLTTIEEVLRVVAQDEPALSVEEKRREPLGQPHVAKPVLTVSAVSAETVPRVSGGKEKILVVEDSPTVASVVKYFLELEGFEMLLAEDGVAGLEIARREQPDVVVSDLYMPDMDGIALVKALRADPRTKDVAILMLTSETSIEKETQALEAGANDYLIKPVEPRRLAARVKAILSRSAEKKLAG